MRQYQKIYLLADVVVPYFFSLTPFDIGPMYIVPVHSRSILELLDRGPDVLELEFKKKD
jgi:hypothetical protein